MRVVACAVAAVDGCAAAAAAPAADVVSAHAVAATTATTATTPTTSTATATPTATATATIQRPLWELGVGFAGVHLPDYRGSDQRRVYALPLPFIVYRGEWLKADRDGARALLFDTERVKIDVSLAATTPTRSRNNMARDGMPDLAPTAEIGPNLNLTLAGSATQHYRLDLRLPVRAAIAVRRSPDVVGSTFSPHLNLDLDSVAGGWRYGLLAGPMFGSRKLHEYVYGVDAAYATGARPAYQARGGYAGWQALAATSRRFGNMWVGAFARYDSLHGAVFETSPLVRRTSAVSFGFAMAWVLATAAELVASED
ncbi:MAG: MipA/OmpV family protein [Bacteriovorax sp.]|nr:MipA/OmpV family protein [Rhizobacter sp.]